MSRRRSGKRTENGRALGEKILLIKMLTRLSRMASSPSTTSGCGEFLAEVAPRTKRKLPIVAVDLTDVAKVYGKKMEDLCLVRDGTSRRVRVEAEGLCLTSRDRLMTVRAARAPARTDGPRQIGSEFGERGQCLRRPPFLTFTPVKSTYPDLESPPPRPMSPT